MEWRRILSGEARGIVAGSLRLGLAAVEPFYGWVVARKNRSFDSGRMAPVRVEAPVISVGNLTVGGTGKTPMVVWLAQWFRQRGIDVTLISRGYGAKAGQANDEALEIAQQLPDVPQLQNPDRVAAAREALEANPRQVLILDDAFQHRRIGRDLDLVLLDALDPFGGGRLLPRGLLREPRQSLARAHAVALSRADAVDAATRLRIRQQVAELAPQALWLELEHRPTSLRAADGSEQPLARLRGFKVAAFCGIGNPAGFFHTLGTCGCTVIAQREFPDHFAYRLADVQSLDAWARESSADAIVCTHKDLVKLPLQELGGRPLWALRIEAAIHVGKEPLEARLRELADRLRT